MNSHKPSGSGSESGASAESASLKESGAGPVWNVREILNWTTQRFAALDIFTPLLDAQLLLGSVLGFSKVQLYIHMDKTLSATERSQMRELVKRRMSGEPVAYLLNQKYWHDLDLFVDKRVLIPRPETESLLDFVLDLWKHTQEKPTTIVDLCTGSGCLAIALAKAYPQARVFAVDISQDALDVARLNAERNNVTNVEFLLGDVTRDALYDYLRTQLGVASIVVANPPYVSDAEWQRCDITVRDFEPKVALTAADNGLAISKKIVENLWRVEMLAAQSCFAIEVGVDHPGLLAKQVSALSDPLAHKQGIAESEPAWNVYANSTSNWGFVRNVPFGLRDLSHKERFLCCIQGLTYAAPPEPQISTPANSLEASQSDQAAEIFTADGWLDTDDSDDSFDPDADVDDNNGSESTN